MNTLTTDTFILHRQVYLQPLSMSFHDFISTQGTLVKVQTLFTSTMLKDLLR